ncbi:hypothetical protein BB559_001609 [Furculomyces boomerangus]|uniref:Uncharacterized protein n=2 Tax=Harpellales TaxID=61421 RepID=A0A2T9Z1D3_9FUNG|nr:hypothetical protein BB559_001609 [Furculomyces boomerangus]PVZ97266.1 hypothetical protein BB558_006779 [Smittium angustum]
MGRPPKRKDAGSDIQEATKKIKEKQKKAEKLKAEKPQPTTTKPNEYVQAIPMASPVYPMFPHGSVVYHPMSLVNVGRPVMAIRENQPLYYAGYQEHSRQNYSKFVPIKIKAQENAPVEQRQFTDPGMYQKMPYFHQAEIYPPGQANLVSYTIPPSGPGNSVTESPSKKPIAPKPILNVEHTPESGTNDAQVLQSQEKVRGKQNELSKTNTGKTAKSEEGRRRSGFGFTTASNSYKSKAAKELHKQAIKLSENEPGALYNYLFNNSKYGKEFMSFVHPENKEQGILENIKLLHQNNGQDHKFKSTILALVAGYYSVKELTDAGFSFSRNQYETAKKKANKKEYVFKDYQRNLPESRRPLSDEELAIVYKFLLDNSKMTQQTIKRGNIPKIEFEGNSMNLQDPNLVPIYHLKKTKLEIFKQLKSSHPNIRLCKSTFYRYIPKNFRNNNTENNVFEQNGDGGDKTNKPDNIGFVNGFPSASFLNGNETNQFFEKFS